LFLSFFINQSVGQPHKKGNFTYKVLDSSLVHVRADLWDGIADHWSFDFDFAQIDSLPKVPRASTIYKDNNFQRAGFSSTKDNNIAITYNKLIPIIVDVTNDGISIFDKNLIQDKHDFWSEPTSSASNPIGFFNIVTAPNITLPPAPVLPATISTHRFYDPKIMFDASSDGNRNKFVIAVLMGNPGDPSGNIECNLVIVVGGYTINGTTVTVDWNARQFTQANLGINSDKWMDRINIGMSEEMFYVTIIAPEDAFANNPITQLVGFKKDDLYSTLTPIVYKKKLQYTHPITSVITDPWCVQPISYGQEGNYGPGIYLIANLKNPNPNVSSDGTYSILFDLTDDLHTATPLLVSKTIDLTTPYKTPHPSIQPPGGYPSIFDLNYCNVSDAFYLDNGTTSCINYVFTSEETPDANIIMYNKIITNSTSNPKEYSISLPDASLVWPSIASLGKDNSAKEVVIGFQSVSYSDYLSNYAMAVHDDGTLSTFLLLKKGDSPIDDVNGGNRGGDYSGTVRQHDAIVPTVWHSGAWANLDNNYGYTSCRNWASEIKLAPLAIMEDTIKQINQLLDPLIFQSENINIQLNDYCVGSKLIVYSIDGKMIFNKNYLQKNEQININNFKPGLYIFALIDSKTNSHYNEKIIIH
jgi:hypothetical protein